MQPIPSDILSDFNSMLNRRNVPFAMHPEYRKWLRYFLDFCRKYPPPASKAEQVRLFAEKMRTKNQTMAQQEQAADAVSLYFALKRTQHISPSTSAVQQRDTDGAFTCLGPAPASNDERGRIDDALAASVPVPSRRRGGKQYDEWRCLRKTNSPAWDTVVAGLADEIRTRHYSRKTLKHYADWSRKFQNFLKDKPPSELSSSEVKAYLTYFAVNCRVSASHQNQAFNALLFLFRHVLKKDFGDHKDVPRAKKSNYIPVVLSRSEIDSIMEHLPQPYRLLARIQYGCGLRISEACRLRVKDFNFDTGLLMVRGKGDKTRTVSLPHMLIPELHAQLEAVKKLHQEDLATGFAGVFLDDQLEKKYPKAATELVWQWFFFRRNP